MLGCFIDEKLNFNKYFSNLKANACRKFFLSFDIKIHFLILKHFYYHTLTIVGHSLFMYYPNTLINKINKLYNLCLFVLLRIDLNNISCEEQQAILRLYNKFQIIKFMYNKFILLNSLYNKIQEIKN